MDIRKNLSESVWALAQAAQEVWSQHPWGCSTAHGAVALRDMVSGYRGQLGLDLGILEVLSNLNDSVICFVKTFFRPLHLRSFPQHYFTLSLPSAISFD